MSDVIRFAAARRTARGSQHAGWLDGGTLHAYDAPVPTDGDTALTTQTLLAVYSLPSPAGTVTDGVFTAGSIAAATNLANGTVAFVRAYDASDVEIGDYDVGTVGSGEAVEIDNLSFVAGSLSTITSFTVTEG